MAQAPRRLTATEAEAVRGSGELFFSWGERLPWKRVSCTATLQQAVLAETGTSIVVEEEWRAAAR